MLTRPSESMVAVILALSAGRVALGLAPFVAVELSSRLMGFPGDHDNPTTRLMARLFGVRDVGLGVLASYAALLQPQQLPFALLFNASMDAGDLLAAALPLARRQGIDRAALSTMLFAGLGGASWLMVWLGLS